MTINLWSFNPESKNTKSALRLTSSLWT